MDQAIARSFVAVKAVARFMAITLTFALAYYLVSAANPTLAKSITEPFGFTIRLASAFKAFTLPFGAAVPLGTFFGSSGFSMSVGDLPFVPMANLGIGLLVALGSKLWGRSTVKDLTLLAVYGLTTGIVVALKMTGWAMLVSPESWMPLITTAFTLRVLSHASVYLMGYPMVLGWERLRRG